MPDVRTQLVEAMIDAILLGMDDNPIAHEEFIEETTKIFGEVVPTEAEPVEEQMMGMGRMVAVLLWRAHSLQLAAHQ